MDNLKGVLYIVSTPIGNLSDITYRAVETLKDVDLVAAEDTRHSRYLLENYNINSRLMSLHQHNERARVSQIRELLDEGKNIALISDAGTPLISDPGYRLVADLRSSGYEIVPVPGPSALIAALSVSGLPTDSFYFGGFLASKSSQRKARLEKLRDAQETLIFYEAPHRLYSSVKDLVEVMGESRELSLARELTKRYETIKLCKAGEMLEWLSSDQNQLKGECVLLVAPAPIDKAISGVEKLDANILSLLENLSSQLPPKKVSQIVSEYTGVPKKVLYQALLAQKK